MRRGGPLQRRSPFRATKPTSERKNPRKPFVATTAPAPLVDTAPRRVAGNTRAVTGGVERPKEHGKIIARAPTAAQRARWHRLRHDVGCIACLLGGTIRQGDQIEVHHLLMKGSPKRLGHDHVIPLCRECHTGGTADRPSRHGSHGGVTRFEAYHEMTESGMQEMARVMLNEAEETTR